MLQPSFRQFIKLLFRHWLVDNFQKPHQSRSFFSGFVIGKLLSKSVFVEYFELLDTLIGNHSYLLTSLKGYGIYSLAKSSKIGF